MIKREKDKYFCIRCSYCIYFEDTDTVSCEKNHFKNIKIKKARYLMPEDFDCIGYIQ